ncbi:unnamed protein product [Triticum turgidum subsp. durum]|uniref:Uncharacterized protein n=1 Tax=Triticum turgidum subsp. durum TaxID=4567 RepID=A0A9R0Y783_TRITD|nr:unnamed protein product [Triticum turgidum subsp. durum]
MKSARSLSRGDGRRLGNASLIAFMLASLVLLSVIRTRLSPMEKTGDAIKAEERHGMSKGSVKVEVAHEAVVTTPDSAAEEEEEEETPPKPADTSSRGGVSVPVPVSTSTTPVPVAVIDRQGKPVCYESGRRSDTCEAAGDVRVQGRSQTIQVRPLDREWKVKPYCRKQDAYALSHVKEWTLRPLSGGGPHCTVNSSATAFVISTGGFTGNLFHDYTDVLVPAFITAHRFGGEVQFLVSSFKSWWTNRYLEIFQQLSRHEVIDIDNDDEVRCYGSVVVGPTFHKELGVDASKTPTGASMVIPYGGLEWLARGTFEEPSKDMQLHYIGYKIQLDETTLSEQYPKDHPVLTDPLSIHKQGWEALKTVYLEKQNVRPHLGRLKLTFLEALKLLPHGRQAKANN